jgi:hypothetical protein
MGGSRRRLKKTRAKVQVGVVKRKKNLKTKVPLEVLHKHDDIAKKLDKTCAAGSIPAPRCCVQRCRSRACASWWGPALRRRTARPAPVLVRAR